MRVWWRHRVPALVIPLHCKVSACPLAFLGAAACAFINAGLQTLHGCKPNAAASFRVIASDTFLTVLQLDK